jgi:hypothetical protein
MTIVESLREQRVVVQGMATELFNAAAEILSAKFYAQLNALREVMDAEPGRIPWPFAIAALMPWMQPFLELSGPGFGDSQPASGVGGGASPAGAGPASFGG